MYPPIYIYIQDVPDLIRLNNTSLAVKHFFTLQLITHTSAHVDDFEQVSPLPWPGPTTMNMNNRPTLRLALTEGNINQAINKLSTTLGGNDLRAEDYFPAPYDKDKIVIIRFVDEQQKTALLSHENFNTWLHDCKLSQIVNRPNTSAEISERSIFIWGIPGYLFTLFTQADGMEEDETLDVKKEQIIDDLKSSLTPKGMKITDYHFIQRDPTDIPRNMRLTFENTDQAKKFLEEDTPCMHLTLPAYRKKKDRHIPIRQCKICRMTSHRQGDSVCDLIKRCPQCLSRTHHTIE